jgi:predicted SAM-dependent methyltransferase
MKLHLGAGAHGIAGWQNLDMNVPTTAAGVVDGWTKWTAPEPMPFADDSVDFVFTEHFIEHLSLDDGTKMLREAHRVLKPGGILRVSTPNLSILVHAYETHQLDFYKAVGFVAATPAQLLNLGMMSWGHQFTYDWPEMKRVLESVGFKNITQNRVGESLAPELRGLECRPDLGDLVVEALK